MIGSFTIAAIAGISTGIFLALLLILTCGICVRAKLHRKFTKWLRNSLLFCAPTTSYEDLHGLTAGDTPASDSLEKLRIVDSNPENLTISTELDSRACGKEDFSGNPCMVQFSLFYNHHKCLLYIHIICALNVPIRWYGRSANTQIRFQLLPDIDNMYATQIQTGGSQPIFNQTFEFVGYSARDLLDLTLRLGIYVYDRFSRGKLLGYTSVPLENVGWDPSEASILWRCLRSPQIRESPSGQLTNPLLHVSLRYEAQASRISVIILKGTSLTRTSKIQTKAPYVRVILSIDDKVIETRQTKRKRTTSPVWNKGFIFDVDSNRMQDYSITIRVMNYDLLLSDQSIGEIVLSARAEGTGREHWDEMMNRKNVRRQIALCHQLQ